MDTKCCSTCAHTRPISSFLKDTSAAPNSRVFATCIPCREVRRRSTSKRKASRQLAPDHPPILPAAPMPINVRVETSMPVEIPISPLPAQALPESRLQPPPPIPPLAPPESRLQSLQPQHAGFLPAEQWQYIQDFNTTIGRVQIESCIRCKEHWFEMNLKHNIYYSCYLRDKGVQTPPLISAENNIDPGDVPAYLPELS